MTLPFLLTKKIIILILFIFLFLFENSLLYAQTTLSSQATPFIHTYSAKEYRADDINTAVKKDRNGILYFANASGVIQFDGKNWRTIKVPDVEFIRTLDIDENGTVFIGTINQLGKLEADSTGKLQFISLLDLLEKEDRNFGEIWKVVATPQGVFFSTDNYIFRYKDNKVKKWKTEGKYFYLTYYVNDQVYVLDIEKGLKKLENEELKLVSDEEFMKNARIYFMLPYPKTQKEEILIGAKGVNFFVYNPKTNEFRDFKTELTEEEKRSISNGIIGKDGNYYISTLRYGIICINQEGKKVFQYKQSDGISNKVYGAELDNQNNLWLALEKGIAKIEIGSPFVKYGENKGITGIVTHAKKYKEVFYVSSTNGVFYYDTDKDNFSAVEGKSFQTWKMQSLPLSFTKDTLFLAITNVGLNQIKNKKWESYIDTEASTYFITTSLKTQNRAYIGVLNQQGVCQLDVLKDGQKTFKQVVPNITTNGLEVKDNLLFVLDGEGKVRIFEEKDSEKDSLEEIKIDFNLNVKSIEAHNQTIFIATTDSVYTWKNNTFQPYKAINRLRKEGEKIDVLFDINDSTIVIRFSDAENVSHYLFNTKNNTSQKLPTDRLLANFISINSFFDVGEKNKIGLGTSEGLFYLDLENDNYQKVGFNVFIRKIMQTDSVLFEENYTDKNTNPILTYQQNSVTFFYSSNNSLDQQNTLFRHRLKGYDKKWSDWTTETKKEYTNLDAGNYSFELEAKNVYGTKSEIIKYDFSIKLPYYKTWWAYTVYFILLAIFVWAIIKWNLKRLQNANIKLEKIVTERTVELREKNNEVLAQNYSITLKNKNINASINYASRIQQAMLPPIEEIKKAFESAFVLWLPRNVVSGDFYWFAKTENKICIAAVDCTGHGIPGAFMSMIGNDMLNNIVLEKKITNPSLILSTLHQQILTALRQAETQNRDGMDIALCVYDTQTKQLEFAGAKSPLYYVQDKEIKQIEGSKSFIGGHWNKNKKERNFEIHTIQVDKPTTFFLCTDGYPDQFGGEKGKKLMKKKMKELFLEIADLKDKEQKEKLENYFLDWKKEEEQVDDVLVMGFKIG